MSDERAIDDPAKLAKAARIMRLALARQQDREESVGQSSVPDHPLSHGHLRAL